MNESRMTRYYVEVHEARRYVATLVEARSALEARRVALEHAQAGELPYDTLAREAIAVRNDDEQRRPQTGSGS